jgi:membrane complex biogenesis BtpA family protein
MAKLLVGVVHLRALPSAARGGGAFVSVLEAALADARALAAGGVDGVMVENFGDAPFHLGTAADPVPPDVPAALAVVAHEVRRETSLPVGVNCLRNDAMAALGAASVAGARWIRVNVLAGAVVADQGLICGEAARVLAYRKLLGAEVEILADLHVKHAVPLAPMPLAAAARDLAERAGADALLVTGERTGEPPHPDLLRQVKRAVGDTAVWIASGLSPDNAASLWPLCDGAIVGTSLKEGGQVHRPVDRERVLALRAAIDA